MYRQTNALIGLGFHNSGMLLGWGLCLSCYEDCEVFANIESVPLSQNEALVAGVADDKQDICYDNQPCQKDEFGCCVVCCECRNCIELLESTEAAEAIAAAGGHEE